MGWFSDRMQSMQIQTLGVSAEQKTTEVREIFPGGHIDEQLFSGQVERIKIAVRPKCTCRQKDRGRLGDFVTQKDQYGDGMDDYMLNNLIPWNIL
jgi:hypothetical protein